MTAQPDPRVSTQEYFRQDQQSEGKLEYYAGAVVAQAGSTAHFWYVRLTDDLADQIAIPAIGCTLALADVYDGVQL